MARRALRGPKWVMPAATFLNSSSMVCRAAHSSSVMYFHPDRRVLSLLGGGDGNRGFFVVLREIVDDEVRSGLLVWSGEAFHHRGGQCFDVPFGEDAGVGSEGECVAVTVINGGLAPSALYLGGVVTAPSMLTSEFDDGGVRGVAAHDI